MLITNYNKVPSYSFYFFFKKSESISKAQEFVQKKNYRFAI